MTLGAIRPDSWGVPLLVHVLGAMVLVGALATVLVALGLSRRGDTAALTRLGFWTLLVVAVPGYILMRAGAQWIYDKENAPDVTWTGIGFSVSDGGLVLLLAATVLAGLAARRLGRGAREPGRLEMVAAVLIGVMLVGYGVAIWAMTTKPS
jgi:hypothetical protein